MFYILACLLPIIFLGSDQATLAGELLAMMYSLGSTQEWESSGLYGSGSNSSI